MTSIRLTQFAGLMPELSAKLKRKDNAQIAHNCLLFDGKLRAMPAYFKYATLNSPPISMFRALAGLAPSNGRVQYDFQLNSAIGTKDTPFPEGVIGLNMGQTPSYVAVRYGPIGFSTTIVAAGMPVPNLPSAATVTKIADGHLSARPEVVSYAFTVLRKHTASNGYITVEESPPRLLGTVGNTAPLWYEGDAVQIIQTLFPFSNGESGVRLYRTITAIESGEKLINTFDTDWYLVIELALDPANPVINYTDNALTQYIPGDLLLTKTFQAPYTTDLSVKFGLSESGWFWTSTKSEIQFSERFMFHAWPIANYLALPTVDEIEDATNFYDTVFLGTTGKPYRVHVEATDDENLNVNAYPYPEHQPCISGTLVTAPFGALYSSVNGVIALQESGMRVVTRDLINSGDILYKDCSSSLRVQDIQKAAWFNGWYIGYAPNGKMFVYEAPEDLNDSHPFQQLITMDAPKAMIPQCWAVGDWGLQIAFDKDIYYWPVPGWVRANDQIEKLTYQWKSKKFVFPGLTTFGAAKVVSDCDGEICFKLWGDCRLLYQRKVCNCKPFRLPHNFRHIEFEIEVIGTGTISEIHVASSMQELTEVNTE